jgi:hypothetical protein
MNIRKRAAIVAWCESAFQAVEQTDVTVMVIEWNEFRARPQGAEGCMRGSGLVDLCHDHARAQADTAGFS